MGIDLLTLALARKHTKGIETLFFNPTGDDLYNGRMWVIRSTQLANGEVYEGWTAVSQGTFATAILVSEGEIHLKTLDSTKNTALQPAGQVYLKRTTPVGVYTFSTKHKIALNPRLTFTDKTTDYQPLGGIIVFDSAFPDSATIDDYVANRKLEITYITAPDNTLTVNVYIVNDASVGYYWNGSAWVTNVADALGGITEEVLALQIIRNVDNSYTLNVNKTDGTLLFNCTTPTNIRGATNPDKIFLGDILLNNNENTRPDYANTDMTYFDFSLI